MRTAIAILAYCRISHLEKSPDQVIKRLALLLVLDADQEFPYFQCVKPSRLCLVSHRVKLSKNHQNFKEQKSEMKQKAKTSKAEDNYFTIVLKTPGLQHIAENILSFLNNDVFLNGKSFWMPIIQVNLWRI